MQFVDKAFARRLDSVAEIMRERFRRRGRRLERQKKRFAAGT
jgi:hypothetical protein